MKKVLLYSGGMDSWLMSKIWKPDVKLYVNMHGRYSDNEIQRIKATDTDVMFVDLPLGQWERDNAIVPLRNLYLTMVACNVTEDDDVEVLIGATAGDRVLDKSHQFVDKANDLLNYLYQDQWWIPGGKKVHVCIDFKDKTKEDLLQMYVDQGGSLEEAFNQSFSCYDPVDGHECWHCKPCFRKFVAFATMGYDFDREVIDTVIPYIKEEILPQIEAGTYGRGEKEETAILSILDKYSN